MDLTAGHDHSVAVPSEVVHVGAGVVMGRDVQAVGPRAERGALDYEAYVDVILGQVEDRPVEVYILAAGGLGMEVGAQLEQRGHLPARADGARIRSKDPSDALEQRRLARGALVVEAWARLAV